MKKKLKQSLKSSLLELGVYAALMAGYYWLVLHSLGGWLTELFVHERQHYAWIALGLILCQGVVLELLTRWLLVWVGPREEGE